MRHILFSESDKYTTAVLIKSSTFYKKELQDNYITLLNNNSVQDSSVIAFTLKYDALGKATAKFIKEYLDELLPVLKSLGITHLYVADANYFKVLTKQSKAEQHLGYVLPCKVDGFTHMKVVLGINYQALIFNPALQAKLELSIKTLSDSLSSNYVALGANVLHSSHYPLDLDSIKATLSNLHQHPSLTCDIEAFSLKFNKAGIGSIAFAWDQHNGIAFLCDYKPYQVKTDEGYFGYPSVNHEVRQLLLDFFTTYQGELIWHNAAYDIKVIVFVLWMKDLLDTEGLLTGLDLMTRAFHDTKIIAYLATNTTAGNVLGLKALAHNFAGNWAQDEIKDICRIAPGALLQYNLIDALSTWYVKDTYTPVMVQDEQEALYTGLMLPSLKTIIQMELSGMPMNRDRVQEVKLELMALEQDCLDTLLRSPTLVTLEARLTKKAWLKNFEDRKAKAKQPDKIQPKNIEEFSDVKFNPNSGPQMQVLLYYHMGLPVLDYTDSKQPATGADTLEKLVHHTDNPDYKAIVLALVRLAKVSKILTSFIPAFEKAIIKEDDWSYLHGSFNLGGTVSGRLSSSAPNLQNIPAKSVYGKLIKSCFEAPKGWLFVGADFNSLEDYISALTTKDPNKMKVYQQGYDGHCLRAFSYFRDKCPDIVDTVESINSMKKLYPELRQDSKGPTFALTYQGTWHTLVHNLGFEQSKAQAIEAGYHDLYQVSDAFVQQQLEQASQRGYVSVAFGLRVRTPLLKQIVFGSKSMPYEAAAEGRTAGNALGQSYGLLNNRAANAFMEKVWASPYRLDIKPVALIHDAIYLMIKDCVEVVEWVNQELILAMQWQELPEIAHDTVKLGSALDIYWPTWNEDITLPNNASKKDIISLCQKAKQTT